MRGQLNLCLMAAEMFRAPMEMSLPYPQVSAGRLSPTNRTSPIPPNTPSPRLPNMTSSPCTICSVLFICKSIGLEPKALRSLMDTLIVYAEGVRLRLLYAGNPWRAWPRKPWNVDRRQEIVGFVPVSVPDARPRCSGGGGVL